MYNVQTIRDNINPNMNAVIQGSLFIELFIFKTFVCITNKYGIIKNVKFDKKRVCRTFSCV